MKTFLDCVPCIVNQAVLAPKRFTNDIEIRNKILRETLEAILNFDMSSTPPQMGGMINEIISRNIGIKDPYLPEKIKFNNLALNIMPQLRKLISKSDVPFETAVRLAIAANIIDFGAPGGLTEGELLEPFTKALKRKLFGGGVPLINQLKKEADAAKSILYLADNTGEIVVDRLLLEMLPKDKVTVVVRSGPAINDALLEDAHFASLDKVAKLMTSGAALPGTPMEETSPEFKEKFFAADLIISKGQGNYETLSERSENIIFLLTAKCDIVANHLNCNVGDSVISKSTQ